MAFLVTRPLVSFLTVATLALTFMSCGGHATSTHLSSRSPRDLYRALSITRPTRLPAGFTSSHLARRKLDSQLRAHGATGAVFLDLNRPPARVLATIQYVVFPTRASASSLPTMSGSPIGRVVGRARLPKSLGRHKLTIRKVSTSVAGKRFTVDVVTSQFTTQNVDVAISLIAPVGKLSVVRNRLIELAFFALRHLRSLQ